MKLFTRFANWLILYSQKKPYFNLDGYMNRWWVIKPHKWLPFASRIHQILRSDMDRHLHDHPWPYITVILRGGYWEVTFVKEGENFLTHQDYVFFTEGGIHYKKRWYGPGSILIRRPKSWHRLVVPDGETTWTWFTVGPHMQNWGFMTPEYGKIMWREYLNEWDPGVSGSPFRLDKNEPSRQNNGV